MDKVHRFGRPDHPIRAARDCMNDVEQSGAAAGRGVYIASDESILHHAFYFYLWRTGPYEIAPKFSVDDTLAKLTTAGEQTPVIVSRLDYTTLLDTLPPAPAATSDSGAPPDDHAALRQTLTKNAVTFDDNVAMLLPGPYASCTAPMLAADGKPIWRRPPLTASGQ